MSEVKSESVSAALHLQAHQAFKGGNPDAVREMLDEDVVWHCPGKSLISGTYRGAESVLGWLSSLGKLTDNTFELHDRNVFGEHAYSTAVFNIRGKRSGQELDLEYCEVVRWHAGKIVELQGYTSDQYALDAFWS